MNVRELTLSFNNCYLVGTSDKHILVDTGYESSWEPFRKQLSEAGVSLSDISHLVLTHHHDDHCGLLNRLVRANPDIRIVMSHRATTLLANGANDRARRTCYVGRRVKLIFGTIRHFSKQWQSHAFPSYLCRERDILIEGETDLDGIGIGLSGRIIETPGHTVDSISLLLEDGSCFVGDAAANMPQFMGTKYCVILLEDIEEYYRSWQKLIAAGAQRIFPAHGKPFEASRLTENLGKITSRDLIPVA
jgi:glyoxylase-like metal-dependent hydrolase (beta-lactamase superfamily II)